MEEDSIMTGISQVQYSDQQIFEFTDLPNVQYRYEVQWKALIITVNAGSCKLEVWNGTDWQEDERSPFMKNTNVPVFTWGVRLRVTPIDGATYYWGI